MPVSSRVPAAVPLVIHRPEPPAASVSSPANTARYSAIRSLRHGSARHRRATAAIVLEANEIYNILTREEGRRFYLDAFGPATCADAVGFERDTVTKFLLLQRSQILIRFGDPSVATSSNPHPASCHG